MVYPVPKTNNVVNSITRQAKYEPFDLQVARGQVYGHSNVNIFGYNTAISSTTTAQNATIAIWENATAYTFPASAANLVLVSSSASDNTKAAISISGLDANFNPISEIILLNGTSSVTTINSYYRVNSMSMVVPGTSQVTNVGTITASQGSNIVAQINPGIGKTQAAIYTVPAGYSYYLYQVEINTDNGYTGSQMYYNVLSKNNNTGVQFDVLQQAFTSVFTIDRSSTPFFYPEKSDIIWQIGTNNSSNVQVGAVINGKLIKNNPDAGNTFPGYF